MNVKLSILIAIVTIITSCNKDNDIEINKNDYLIFGHYYGKCLGERCVETFKLTHEKLFEDLNDSYSGKEPFNFIELGNDKFQKVKDLIDFIPSELMSEKSKTFGCPDCADRGGLLIMHYKNGKLKKWKIDNFESNVPGYLHDFMMKVNEKIDLLND